MKKTILIVICVFCILYQQVICQYNEEYQNWLNTYRKNTKRSLAEAIDRKKIWTSSYETIMAHNKRADKGLETYRQGLNEFSDMTYQEFIQKFTGYVPSKKMNYTSVKTYNPVVKNVPDSKDWTRSAVNAARQQGTCGSCFAFAAIGVIEGQVYKQTNNLWRLSAQQIVDCQKAVLPNICTTNCGCNGGNLNEVYTYLKQTGGIVQSDVYPYISGLTNAPSSTCQANPPDDSQIVAKVTGYVSVCDSSSASENNLKNAIANVGPIFVAVYVGEYFKNYKSGIMSDSAYSNQETNHAVLAVGYGTDATTGQDYFTIMNSWGASWGDRGLGKIARNSNFMLGIGKSASYVTIDTNFQTLATTTPSPEKLENIDSKILARSEVGKIYKMVRASSFNLLYRASRDGFLAKDFHDKCDGIPNTIVLVKRRLSNYVFGGVTTKAWDSTGNWITDNKAYLFSLRRGGFGETVKFYVNVGQEQNALLGDPKTGPNFGNNLILANDAFNEYSNTMSSCDFYACPLEYIKATSQKYFTGSLDKFRVQDYEVFQYVPLPPDPLITAKLDTVILNLDEINLLFDMLKNTNLKLLYRASVDGGANTVFHSKCDNKANTITIIKMYRSDYVFGGYLSIPWSSSGGYQSDNRAYLFSIRRNGRSDQIYKAPIAQGQYGPYFDASMHIFFQQGLTLQTNPLTSPFNNMASCNPIWVCPNNSGCQTQSETSLFYTGNASGDFKAEEVEVFQIINSINN